LAHLLLLLHLPVLLSRLRCCKALLISAVLRSFRVQRLLLQLLVLRSSEACLGGAIPPSLKRLCKPLGTR
jgi:hypothetical protein